MYLAFITTSAQVVLAQRFGVLNRFGRSHPFLLLQNLCDNEEEQMDRGHPVYNCRRTIRSWSLHFHSLCNEPPRSILPPYYVDPQVPELKETTFASRDTYDPSGYVSSMSYCYQKGLGNRSNVPQSHFWQVFHHYS